MSNVTSESGQGIILIFFRTRDSLSSLPRTFEDWLHQEYVPALSAIAGLETAWAYTAADAAYDKQQLVVCKVLDLALVQAETLSGLTGNGKISPPEGLTNGTIESDMRTYSFVQLYETTKQDRDAAPVILLAMMQPAKGGDSDLDAWYRDEHNQQMSEQSGWRRTTRFNLLHQLASSGQKSEELSFLAIHEFGNDNKLGTTVQALEPISDWTKKVMGEAKMIDAAIYYKQESFGASEKV